MKNPRKVKVSVLSIAYNHSKYIEQALQSMLQQETNFDYEIIIGDDCSTDDTPNIIRRISKQYPDRIIPVLRDRNIGIQNNLIDIFTRASGEYIALCEGDDYWIDSKKLQRQVDFLEYHKDYALCFHPVEVLFEDKSQEKYIFPDRKKDFSVRRLLENNFIQTNSVLYRKQDYYHLEDNLLPMDWYLHLYHARFGKIGFIDETMSVYRRHRGGVWWQTSRGGDVDSIWKKHGASHINLYVELLKIYNEKEYMEIIDKHLEGTIEALVRIDNTERTEIISKYIRQFSSQTAIIIEALSRINTRHSTAESDIITELDGVKHDLRVAIGERDELHRDYNKLLNSRSYRVGLAITAPYRKLREMRKEKNE